ncbi:MAG: response regulator transcription factor [bacterium]
MEQKKILVADDEQEICDLLEQTLSQEGYSVTCVNDGQTAFDRLKQEFYDLALLDVCMPHIDGYHLSYKITTQLSGPVPKIILLTSRDAKQDNDIGTKSGADMQLSKPFDASDLINKVKQLIGSAESL